MADNIIYQNTGAFVPNNWIWDVQQIPEIDVKSAEFKELLVRLYQNLNLMNIVLNIKDSAYYNNSEFVNGQLWFPNPALNSSTDATPDFRQVYRTVVNFGPLLVIGLNQQPHNIVCSTTTSFTRIYGVATKPTAAFEYIPLPYSSATAADNIEVFVDATNVNIVTAADYTAYTIVYVVLEYIQT